MRKHPLNPALVQRLAGDEALGDVDWERLSQEYEGISARFHTHLAVGAQSHHQNALYHRIRYLDLLRRPWPGRVLDVGNDKPFLTFFLRRFNPDSAFETISAAIPETPTEIHEVDIEQERFPFEQGTFDRVIFTEVIEHLWRNPSHCVHEINRVMRVGGEAFVTTPNPCDRHAIVCALWQTNPNNRSEYFATLESGHLHLWTAGHLKLLFEAHGFASTSLTTQNLYGHTKKDANIDEIVARISPFGELMNEAVVLVAAKQAESAAPCYPLEIFPEGKPVQFQGAIRWFAEAHLRARPPAPK